eukprot:PITA_36315
MGNQEREASIRPPIFDASNFVYWKIRTTTYLQLLGTDFWGIVEGGYTYPSAIPIDTTKRKQYELNAKVVTVLLGSLSQLEFVKVKRAKLQTLRIRYENLKMHSNESIANYFLRIDEIVNCMRNMGEEIKEVVLVEKVLRSLSAKFESKVSAIEEKEDLQKITMTQLHRILTTFEMRKGGPSDMREAAFEVSGNESEYISEGEDEVNFVKNLEQGSGRFKGKLPFKCFSCGRVGHYIARFPHNKGKMYEKGNRSYYIHDKSNDSSNSDEDIRLLMAYENKNVEPEEVTRLKEQLESVTRILSLKEDLKESKNHNEEAPEEQEHEVIELRHQVEEGRKAEENIRKQYLEKEEKHQVEVNILKSKLEEKDKLLRFQDSTKILDDILGIQRSPTIKTGLGFYEYVEGDSSSQG